MEKNKAPKVSGSAGLKVLTALNRAARKDLFRDANNYAKTWRRRGNQCARLEGKPGPEGAQRAQRLLGGWNVPGVFPEEPGTALWGVGGWVREPR